MPELLLEILSEEIPARMQARAAEDIKRLVTDGLKSAGLVWTRADSCVTPRRLALVVDGLPAATADVSEERRGPRVGAPQAAIDGFLKSAGVTLEQCEKRDTGKGEFWFAKVETKGRATIDAAKTAIEAAMAALPWPKSMRWGTGRTSWVRPIHSIVALFDGKVVGVEFAGLLAGNVTRGHRFLSGKPFAVANFADYAAKLRDAHVILDQSERRAMIDSATRVAAAKLGLTVRPDIGLLDEVTGLVEWPVVLTGSIDAAFMGVPQEVLITAMRAHQKYFALLDRASKLAPHFLTVANIATHDHGREIVAGNERVLRARLSDARFFWDQDKKTRLDVHLPKLAGRVFFEGLGTIADKVERVRELARLFAPHTGADAALAERAALLAKADLTTEMVGEFPELQGVMGRYYAINDGEDASVALAIAEHYKPLGPDDSVPAGPVSIAVALADKLDTLAGFFTIGEKPTGSKDPFALRRAGIGMIRLILENKVRIMLWTVICRATALYGKDGKSSTTVAKEVLDFLIDRLKVHLREQGARHDLIAAAMGRAEDDLVRLVARIAALGDFLATDDGKNLLVAYRRAANILKIEEGKDKTEYKGDADSALLKAPEEKALAQAIAATAENSSAARSAEDYAGAMAALAGLRAPVDAFFDKVTVNAEEPALRANRLKLLSGIAKAMDRVADFSKVEG
jgi:glycyl-tRNA synthetase beta chain